jgi:capsular exopolysaccharide synthesis family protein
MVTSASPEDGKTITAANLAVTLAQAGQRVVLVDADLRRPSQHNVFGLSNATGLTTILMDPEARLSDVLQTTEVKDLRVMTAGPTPPNPSEIIGSKRMGYLIEALQHESDVVIFDSPPLLAVTDSAVLGARLGSVLIVVSASRTRRGQLQQGKEKLDAVGARVIGVVLNRLAIRGDNSYHQYYLAEGNQHPQSRAAQLRAVLAESSLIRRFAPRATPQRTTAIKSKARSTK